MMDTFLSLKGTDGPLGSVTTSPPTKRLVNGSDKESVKHKQFPDSWSGPYWQWRILTNAVPTLRSLLEVLLELSKLTAFPI